MSPSRKNFQDAYLQTDNSLQAFYSFPPNEKGIQAAIQNRKRPAFSGTKLVEVLRSQYEGLKISPALELNLQKLERDNTFTLTTGHQLCIFGGPLFVAEKVLSVIRLAAQLTETNKEKNFVPIFWLASEDHDDEEVRKFFTSETEFVRYKAEFFSATGRHVIGKEIEECFSNPQRSHFSAIYSKGKSWSRAFRELWNEWLGEKGVVILDPDDRNLKEAFLPIMLKELEMGICEKEGLQTNVRLENEGFPLQLHFRKPALFYLTNEKRERILLKEGQFFTESGHSWSLDEIKACAKQFPERFSPNAALRPVYQEFLLPNIVYSGGWAELAYWFQLKDIFRAFSVDYPVLIPRMNASILGSDQLQQMEQCGIQLAELSLGLEAWQSKLYAKYWDSNEFEPVEAQMVESFQTLEKHAGTIDSTLSNHVQAQLTRLKKFMESLKKKIKKSIRNKYPKPFLAALELDRALNPDGKPQERKYDLTYFAPGKEMEFLELLYTRCIPLDFSHLWINKL